MHTSTRVLLILAAGIAIAAGWWILLAINSAVVGTIYSVLWTVIVLVAARVLAALGFGYNRFSARRGRDARSGSATTSTALAELSDLRDRRLISPDEYNDKRAKVLERL